MASAPTENSLTRGDYPSPNRNGATRPTLRSSKTNESQAPGRPGRAGRLLRTSASCMRECYPPHITKVFIENKKSQERRLVGPSRLCKRSTEQAVCSCEACGGATSPGSRRHRPVAFCYVCSTPPFSFTWTLVSPVAPAREQVRAKRRELHRPVSEATTTRYRRSIPEFLQVRSYAVALPTRLQSPRTDEERRRRKVQDRDKLTILRHMTSLFGAWQKHLAENSVHPSPAVVGDSTA